MSTHVRVKRVHVSRSTLSSRFSKFRRRTPKGYQGGFTGPWSEPAVQELKRLVDSGEMPEHSLGLRQTG